MESPEEYWLTRLLFQRALALVYLVAFTAALRQFKPLLGARGLLPAARFVKLAPFSQAPSLFHFFSGDAAFSAAAWAGIGLSLLAATGLADGGAPALSFAVWAGVWTLYLSFVNVGQEFYAFGWESILLEAGFYAMFLGPRDVPVPRSVVWMLRWLLFRVMFGAGLIKLRGDPCWRDLTCLDHHFMTQPIPNPLSWGFHHSPAWTRRLGALVNHAAELAAPWGLLGPPRWRAAAGTAMIVFQLLIMASGNLSWLNLLTIVLCIPAFDDRALSWAMSAGAAPSRPAGEVMTAAVWSVAALVSVLSLRPVLNMLSRAQAMNASYNPLHLVGSYGAFGGVTKRRFEIVLEGTDGDPALPETRWKEYEFKGKPGDPLRRPPQISPYHLRLDWLMWFAAMSPSPDPYRYPWFVPFVRKLLEGDREVLALLRTNPFPDKPPRFVRAGRWEYRFTTPAERRATGAWWTRERVGEYLPPASLP